MLRSIRQISILNKIFNVKGNEWSRITVAWFMRFFYRTSFVIGWTLLVAMFVSSYGIYYLPYLFIANAVFTAIGSVLYNFLLEKFHKETLLIYTVFISSAFLLTAAILGKENFVLFFSLLVVSISVFFMQFKIVLDGYIEEMFNPLQSERTFPFIEGAETIGGITGGLLMFSLAKFVDSSTLIYLMIVSLLLIVPFILFYKNTDERLNSFKKSFEPKKDTSVISPGQKSYIKGLFFIVLLQWLIFNILEFQYTNAVYQNVSSVVLEGGSGFEHVFIHDLGALFMLFSVSALVIQFFIGSRLISSLGVFGSMILHVVVTFLSFFGMILSFNFTTAVLAKNNFTMTSVIHLNAYHISYYAIHEEVREHTRELLDGIVRPIGAIVGTFILILMQKVFVGSSLIFSVNVVMIASTLIAFYVTYIQGEKYTNSVLHDLTNRNEKFTRLTAVTILGQKGHKSANKTLCKVLSDESESLSVRIKILKLINNFDNFVSFIPSVIKCLESKEPILREFALDALISCKNLSLEDKVFLRNDLFLVLQKFYESEKDEDTLVKIIFVMSLLSNVCTLQFLLDILNKEGGAKKVEAIAGLGRFNDTDVIKVLKPYLKSKSEEEKINAAISLFKFGSIHSECVKILSGFLSSKNSLKLSYGLYAIGELRLNEKKNICIKYLRSGNTDVKINSAVSLLKLDDLVGLDVVVNALFSHDENLVKNVKYLLRSVDARILCEIDKILLQMAVDEMGKIMDGGNHDFYMLKHLYELAEDYDEVKNLNNILKSNKQ
ncbi:MAG: hypothetical protein AAB848_02940 [Patescibacteria group bacterium]